MKSTFNTQDLIELVKVEADNIKQHATSEEINRLNFEGLYPSNAERCIYGQMTGNCYSIRANKLIIECATRVYKLTDTSSNALAEVSLNGKPKKESDRASNYHSPIEIFIYGSSQTKSGVLNNKRLINYLKGKTNKLKLKLPKVIKYED